MDSIMIESRKSQKIPVIITLTFFLVSLYIAFVHHNYWTFDIDGKYYLEVGEQILQGDGENSLAMNAGVGGPIIYAFFDQFVNDGFSLLKIIAVICSSAITFITYHIIRNFFDHRTAIVGQLFLIFNPYFLFFSIQAENELLPFFLFIASLYFITKENFSKKDVILSGFLIGIAFTIRYQFAIGFLSYLVFIIIHNNNFRKKIFQGIILIGIFLVTISPVLIYNDAIYDSAIGGNTSWYIAQSAEFSSPEFREEASLTNGILDLILLDPDLFLKNYFWNMFYNMPGYMFNFNFLGNISLSPVIPFVGVIPFLGGLWYNYKKEFSKMKLLFLISVIVITTIIVLSFGDLPTHGTAIFLIPTFTLILINIKKIKQNFLPILIIPIVFFLVMSILRLFSGEQFFIFLISASIFSAIFFMKVIPEIYFKIRKMKNISTNTKGLQIFLIIVIGGLFISDLGYSYVLYRANSSGIPFESIEKEISYLFNQDLNQIERRGEEYKKGGDILSKELNIDEKYIMTNNLLITPYVDSKLVFTLFNEGPENDTLENFITRENWSEYELFISDVSSIPSDRLNKFEKIPDYLVFTTHDGLRHKQHDFLRILADPENSSLSSNLETIFVSERINLVIYKIHHNSTQ